MSSLITDEQKKLAGELKENIAIYQEAKDLIDIGAYKQGSNPLTDYAISVHYPIQDFLKQSVNEYSSFEDTLTSLTQIFDLKDRL
jgi:flagellum-specific ATP synthase